MAVPRGLQQLLLAGRCVAYAQQCFSIVSLTGGSLPRQIKCGDRYEDGAVQAFNACAVSAKQCVPQRVDEGVWPVPPECALDANFDLNKFQGRWYITAGLNPLFDTFPCQEHYFGVPEPGELSPQSIYAQSTSLHGQSGLMHDSDNPPSAWFASAWIQAEQPASIPETKTAFSLLYVWVAMLW